MSTGNKVISAKLDIVFKMLFANEKNLDILEAFLSDLLDIPPGELHNVKVKNPEIEGSQIDEKYYRLDLNLDIGNQLVNVEMQVRQEKYFADRSLVYWSKLYSSQLDTGEKYTELCPCIAVNIMDYIAFDKHEDFHSKFEAWDVEHNHKLSDKMEIHFFELKKVEDKPDASNRKKLWLQFIKADTEEAFAMLENVGIPEITKGVHAIYAMNSDEKAKEFIRMREKALHDRASELAAEREEGIAIGRAEGKAEGRAEGRAEMGAEIAARMRAAGIPESEIQKFIKG